MNICLKRNYSSVLTPVYFSYRQLDISSYDLPAKDTVRYTEDQITIEKNQEHSMNNGEQLLAVTIVTHYSYQRGKQY